MKYCKPKQGITNKIYYEMLKQGFLNQHNAAWTIFIIKYQNKALWTKIKEMVYEKSKSQTFNQNAAKQITL